MVSKSSDKHKAVRTNIPLLLSLLFVFVFASAFIAAIIIKDLTSEKTEPAPVEDVSVDIEPGPTSAPEPVLPSRIDFQNIVDTWVDNVSGSKSVIVYDLDREELVGSYNTEEAYNTASLYKLFVVYDGYMKIQNGEWSADAPAGGTGHTVLECLDLAIRESNSNCAETLWSMTGRDNLEATIRNHYGIINSDIKSLVSNPNDILKMMQIFYRHEDITDDTLLARMKDSFLVQPPTTYNWRQGLPSGFSKANVYNKVGWDYNPDGRYWNIYHDAAIVEFPEDNRHFIVVVMTNKVPFQKITDLGRQIENHYYNQ